MMKTKLLILLMAAACAGNGESRTTDQPPSASAKNVILLIGDGMGFPQVTLCRLLYGSLTLDAFPSTGFVMTRASDGWVTDSAAGATAMSAGTKTRNSAIGVDPDGEPVRTILEDARDHGHMTGMVTTSRVTHATPAAFAAHVKDRSMEAEIAGQLASAKLDVLIGGGRKYFTEETILEMRKKGALIELHADSHIPYVLDREQLHAFLPDMTRKAIGHMNRSGKSFFLLVEGARIDHACHSNDAASSAAETREFDEAVRAALDFARKDGRTLVIATADHGTGALAITEKAQQRRERFRRITASADAMVAEIEAGRPLVEVLAERAGVTDSTQDEAALFVEATGDFDRPAALGEIVGKRLGVTFIPLRYRMEPPNATLGHDGAMVPVYAYGPGAERFAGTIDNTDIAKRIRELTGW